MSQEELVSKMINLNVMVQQVADSLLIKPLYNAILVMNFALLALDMTISVHHAGISN